MRRPEVEYGGHNTGGAGEDWTRAARRLLVDRTTAEVVTAMRAEGIRPLLLKGPVIARWLYADDPARRAYTDVDLFVAPDRFEDAVSVLSRLGFSGTDTVRLRGERVPHAQPFGRPGAAPVDLHRSLHDLEDVAPARVWTVISADSEAMTVGGVAVDTPNAVARTLHTVFHVSLEDPDNPGPIEDLRRAVELVDQQTWRAALRVVRDFGVEPMMAAKLRLVPGGMLLAQALGMSSGHLPARLLTTREEHSPPYVHTLARLAELPGVGARLRYLRAKAFPPASFLRQWTPVARLGTGGLVAARVLRIGWTLLGIPVAPLLWWRARRQARHAAQARASGGELR